MHTKTLKEKLEELQRYKIELALEKKVIADIRKRQSAIPGLRQDALKYTATWGGEMTPGCSQCCLQGKWTQIRTTTQCSLACPFCYYFGQKDSPGRELIPPEIFKIGSREFREDDVKLLFEAWGERLLRGVAWLQFEPLMAVDKMLSLMRFISKKGYHQWLYTNGVRATEDTLKKLADAGLNEIRFNLAATDCSDGVIGNMRIARKYFKYLCIESPMFSAFHRSFMHKRKMILDSGVDHIHFAELQVFSKTRKNFKDEGPLYRYRKGYISPIKSRHLTYDVFETAAREKWKNVVLHDCSNETKFLRGVYNAGQTFGTVDYSGFLDPDASFYSEALRYL